VEERGHHLICGIALAPALMNGKELQKKKKKKKPTFRIVGLHTKIKSKGLPDMMQEH
jgi:hypothetical protein